ncbi:putative ribonuclease H-like domain-containing protein [Tanacetum coccineum]
MVKDFTREDLIELYMLVMQKYGTNRPEDAYDRVLWSDLRTMFDPPLNEDAIWSLPLQQKMINWRYYPTCAVYCLTLEASTIYMLADRKYPLSKYACQVMLKMKLLCGTMDEVCYQLLKMIKKQAGIRKNLGHVSVDIVRHKNHEIELVSKGANSLQAEGLDLFSKTIQQQLSNNDDDSIDYHNLWDVIVNGDLEEEPAPTGDQSGPSAPPAPKTAKQLAARRNQERVKSILLLAILDEYLPLKVSQRLSAKSSGGNQIEIAIIMRNKPDIDEIDSDDLYNNLRVYEDELKRSLGSNSASQKLAFLSSENTSSTNKVSTASGDLGISTVGGINQMDGDDLEELDLRWQVAMLTVKVKKSNAQTNESSSQALVAQDGLGSYDWSNDFEVEPVIYALMAISSLSSSSSSNSKVQKCSKQCLESFKCLQKNYDTEREKHNKAKLEIKGYEIALESLESRILGHEKMNWLGKAVKERDELKDKIAKWEESSKNLDEILNSQMSARDKTGLGYSTQLNDLSCNHETNSENSFSIFDGRSSDEDSTPANDKSSQAEGYKVLDNKTSDPNTVKPKPASESVVSNPKINKERVIIEDWYLDDEEEVSEMETVRPKTQTVKTRDDKSGQNSKKQGISFRKGNPKILLQDHAVVDSGCSSHMTGNKAYLSDYEDYNRGFVAFRSDPKEDKLKFNLFSVSQMCDKKNSVLFTKSECLILSPSFKLLDESQVVLRAPRKDDVYSLDLKNIVPSGGITCLYANATADESKLWHRRLGHVNLKNINKLVKGHLVRGLPSKFFVNDHTCVACKKGKQHKASCKAKLDRIIRKPLELLHMNLFGLVSVESINKKRYCLVVTDDFSRFSWVFFLATKDETSEILCNLIIGLEKQLNHNVKIIRCDNGTEFKNYAMNELCAKKGIKREFSVARTPQQNGVAERKNRTLIEAARTMLADSLLPIPFWAEAVNTACYVLNRVLVTKP